MKKNNRSNTQFKLKQTAHKVYKLELVPKAKRINTSEGINVISEGQRKRQVVEIVKTDKGLISKTIHEKKNIKGEWVRKQTVKAY